MDFVIEGKGAMSRDSIQEVVEDARRDAFESLEHLRETLGLKHLQPQRRLRKKPRTRAAK